MTRYFLLLLFVFAASVNVAGQNLVVKKFFHAERDGTANRGSTCIMDQNDEPCALIKVRTNQRGFTFDAGQLLPIEKTEEQTSAHPLEIYVWVQSGVKRLSIGHAQLGNLYDYDLGTALQPGQTYILELVSGEVQTVVKQARSHQYVVFQLTPPNAVVTIGGEMLETNDGIARKLMKMGKYNYTVQAPNYQQEVGRIEVNNPDEKHVVNVTLKPNFTQVTLTAPDDAEIWVNGERKGNGSWKGNLNGGDYLFETKKASHRDAQLTKTIDLSEGPQTIQLPAPTPILGDADFDSKPAMADIYIDGKKVGQTPQLVSNLLVGSHTVKLVRSGYNDYTGNITIKEGETAPFSATLIKGSLSETASGEGEVILLCKSLTADIYVDGSKVGTGRWEGKLSAGRHTVSCRALNFKNADATIEVVGGQKKFFQLEAPQKGRSDTETSKNITAPPNGGGSANVDVNLSNTNTASDYLIFKVNDVEFTMVKVKAGTFTMGATKEHEIDAVDNEKPAHKVTLTKDYLIGQTEVSQALWKAVMGNNPSKFKDDNLPVEMVSWIDCQTFIEKLNTLTGAKFRLPTEAEWEYAARGGDMSCGYKYSGSSILGYIAYFKDNSDNKTHDIGSKSPNELGLYDMSGNVWEWCNDNFGSYSRRSKTNPTGPKSSFFRICRGGAWDTIAAGCRVSARSNIMEGVSYSNLGFRLAM
ncbi:MAG: SUMF1/EgtB/PvdO family nonheme iron enzyme [Bacteroidaceae bacterium]|nr:SUMF1/EgtB/PvdO family nonheme iron enzyme [Bacteroidaceae bacterium]